jgi:hypothetical protein
MSIFTSETTELEKIEEVENEIREFLRRDVAGLRRQPGNNGKIVADNVSSLLHRVSINSTQEVDRLIGEPRRCATDWSRRANASSAKSSHTRA